MNHPKNQKLAAVFLIFTFLCGVALIIPPVTQRMAYYLEQIQIRIRYWIKPPERAIFVPNEQVAAIVFATLQPTYLALSKLPPQMEETGVQASTQPVLPTPALIAVTPTPLPPKVVLEGVRYQSQHGLWNYCAPANLAMALSYWGWQGDRMDTGRYLKPLDDDKNVMPYEMENYVIDKTSYGVIYRYGGTLSLLKSLVAQGFPVLLETGVYIRGATTGKLSWTGHYTLVTGYDESDQVFITQDSYYQPDYMVDYQDLLGEWRSFNYVFMVIYPPERQAEIDSILEDAYADLAASALTALQKANEEVMRLSQIDRFFAMFNRGSSYVWLQDYASAAASYDEAFRLYPSLPEDRRPWRIMWYQTGPYFAYYYSGRYQDVINLANQTLNIHDPFLEESYYWRGRAKYALGDTEGALKDIEESLKLHEGFIPSVEFLQEIGGSN